MYTSTKKVELDPINENRVADHETLDHVRERTIPEERTSVPATATEGKTREHGASSSSAAAASTTTTTNRPTADGFQGENKRNDVLEGEGHPPAGNHWKPSVLATPKKQDKVRDTILQNERLMQQHQRQKQKKTQTSNPYQDDYFVEAESSTLYHPEPRRYSPPSHAFPHQPLPPPQNDQHESMPPIPVQQHQWSRAGTGIHPGRSSRASSVHTNEEDAAADAGSGSYLNALVKGLNDEAHSSTHDFYGDDEDDRTLLDMFGQVAKEYLTQRVVRS